MTTAAKFEGEVIVGVGTYSIPVTATDVSGNAGSVTNTKTFTANGLSTTLAYDLSGNQTLKSNATSVLTFGWDGANRCVAITNGIYRTALSYDGANRWTRITEYSNSVVIADRRFIWNGVTLAEERDANNNVVQRFYSDGFQRGGTNYFYVKDHLGSVREVHSQSGVIQARFDYDPYGNKTQTYGTLKIDFGFAGLFELPNGMKLAVWRVYDGARWLSKDPIREQGGLNLYAYCGGDPVSKRDDLGLRDYDARETQEILATIRQAYQGEGWLTKVFLAAYFHSRSELFDFKAKSAHLHGTYKVFDNPDRFCVNGTWLSADQFGNYIAGYSTKYGVGGMVGGLSVRLAGSLYGIKSIFDENKIDRTQLLFLGDDLGSARQIVQGEKDALRDYLREHGFWATVLHN